MRFTAASTKIPKKDHPDTLESITDRAVISWNKGLGDEVQD